MLFARKGIAGTRIADVEAAVGLAVGTGSFHRHFRNKDELLVAVASSTGLGLPSLDVAANGDDLAVRIEAAVGVLQDQATLLALVSRLQVERPELAAALHEGFVGWVTPPDGGRDPRTTIITSAVVGYVVTRQTFGRHPGGLDPATFSEQLAAMAESVG